MCLKLTHIPEDTPTQVNPIYKSSNGAIIHAGTLFDPTLVENLMQGIRLEVSPNGEIDTHMHPYVVHYAEIADGDGVFVVEGEEHKLESGVRIVIPRFMWHKLIAGKHGIKMNILTAPNYELGRKDTIYLPDHRPYTTKVA